MVTRTFVSGLAFLAMFAAGTAEAQRCDREALVREYGNLASQHVVPLTLNKSAEAKSRLASYNRAITDLAEEQEASGRTDTCPMLEAMVEVTRDLGRLAEERPVAFEPLSDPVSVQIPITAEMRERLARGTLRDQMAPGQTTTFVREEREEAEEERAVETREERRPSATRAPTARRNRGSDGGRGRGNSLSDTRRRIY